MKLFYYSVAKTMHPNGWVFAIMFMGLFESTRWDLKSMITLGLCLTYVQTKYVKVCKGNASIGHNGWTKDGMLRYNALHLAVAIDRNKNSVGFQKEFVDYVRLSPARTRTDRRNLYDDQIPPIQIWSEEDVKHMAQNHCATQDNQSITKFGSVWLRLKGRFGAFEWVRCYIDG